jgi:hypothetical protein
LAVGKLRAHASKEVADLAKEIVKKWKSAVEKAKHASGATTPTNAKYSSGVNGKLGASIYFSCPHLTLTLFINFGFLCSARRCVARSSSGS